MSGRGETPEERTELPYGDVTVGTTLFTASGDRVGTIRSLEEGGVFVSRREGLEELSLGHVRTGHAFGAGELVWRCTTCGAMGPLEGGIPNGCPDCVAPREALMYWTED